MAGGDDNCLRAIACKGYLPVKLGALGRGQSGAVDFLQGKRHLASKSFISVRLFVSEKGHFPRTNKFAWLVRLETPFSFSIRIFSR